MAKGLIWNYLAPYMWECGERKLRAEDENRRNKSYVPWGKLSPSNDFLRVFPNADSTELQEVKWIEGEGVTRRHVGAGFWIKTRPLGFRKQGKGVWVDLLRRVYSCFLQERSLQLTNRKWESVSLTDTHFNFCTSLFLPHFPGNLVYKKKKKKCIQKVNS